MTKHSGSSLTFLSPESGARTDSGRHHPKEFEDYGRKEKGDPQEGREEVDQEKGREEVHKEEGDSQKGCKEVD